MGDAPAAPAAAQASGLGWQALSAIAVGLAVTGGAGYFAFSSKPEPVAVVAPAPVQAPVAPPVAEAAPAPEPAAVTAVAVAPTPADARPSTARRSSDRLAEEVAILSRAETELHAGHFSSALRLLDEHARSFPRGTLTQERVAARVHALCGLGRVAEAQADLARLSPGSIQGARAREACAKH